LVVSEAVVGTIEGSCHGDVSVDEEIVGGKMVILLVGVEDGGRREIERAGRRRGVGDRRADTACAEASKKRGAVVCSRHG
jgi:hypothetical protein